MSDLFSLLGWAFLPSLISTWILSFLYRLFTRAGDPIPTPGHPRYARDHRRINIAVITLYLLWTIYESYQILVRTPNFYTLLSVPYAVTDKALKSQFRRLSVKFHPDKVGPDGEEFFVVLKQAYETLLDPGKRFGYDRFGADTLAWRGCVTAREFLYRGAQAIVPYYGAGVLFLVILNVMGKLEFGRYWRFYALAFLLTFESLTLTRLTPFLPAVPGFLYNYFQGRPLLQFEQLILARKLTITVFIAMSQLGPLLIPRSRSSASIIHSLAPHLERLDAYTKLADAESTKTLVTEVLPFEREGKLKTELQGRLKEWMIEMKVQKAQEVRDAMGRVLQRKRDAPHGAIGTR
ncbi:hypothetical protein RUND412_000577 [Rhizina undulata]